MVNSLGGEGAGVGGEFEACGEEDFEAVGESDLGGGFFVAWEGGEFGVVGVRRSPGGEEFSAADFADEVVVLGEVGDA